jgi:hypothetical protein
MFASGGGEGANMGESALILQAQSACKISALNAKYTSEILPSPRLTNHSCYKTNMSDLQI